MTSDRSQSSVGLVVLDAMIDETAGGATAIINAAVKENGAFAPTWAQVGAEIGVGVRLRILREVRERVLTAELKAREEGF